MSTERRRARDDELVMPSLRLDGRVALVTGGNRGLGLGVALGLAHAGADIALCARTRDELEQAAELVRGVGRKAFTVVADLTDSDNVRDAVRDTADHYGRLDILVNGAGVNVRQPADTFTDADWERVMTVNLKSAFFACQEAARVMRRQGKGKIVNITSLASEIVLPNIALYAMSKGGMRQMTKALALEWARDRINVNAIAPGRFGIHLPARAFRNPAPSERPAPGIPLGGPALPQISRGRRLFLPPHPPPHST